MYQKFRYLKQNIGIVATFDCHNRQDKSLEDQEKRNELEIEFDLLLKNI